MRKLRIVVGVSQPQHESRGTTRPSPAHHARAAEGKGNKDVAVAMQLSVKTVETHRSNINRKLSIRSTSDLVRYAVRNGIVDL